MKLCRFELLSEPGQVRSGIVRAGKIYETDGAEAIAVHEAADVRPMSPVELPPSVRFFRGLTDEGAPRYAYGNAATMIGASRIVPIPEFVARLEFEPYLACVIASPGANVPVDFADDLILGYTIVTALVSRDEERRSGPGSARSMDFGCAFGPALTTPEEMEDVVASTERGRRFRLAAVGRVNGVEKLRGDAYDLPITFAQAISHASESWPLQPGEVIALGPLCSPIDEAPQIGPGDEIQVAIEQLGTLSTKIA